MHLVYSALGNLDNSQAPQPGPRNEQAGDIFIRYQAYQAVCGKYRKEIAAIQKYLPGWMPEFK